MGTTKYCKHVVHLGQSLENKRLQYNLISKRYERDYRVRQTYGNRQSYSEQYEDSISKNLIKNFARSEGLKLAIYGSFGLSLLLTCGLVGYKIYRYLIAPDWVYNDKYLNRKILGRKNKFIGKHHSSSYLKPTDADKQLGKICKHFKDYVTKISDNIIIKQFNKKIDIEYEMKYINQNCVKSINNDFIVERDENQVISMAKMMLNTATPDIDWTTVKIPSTNTNTNTNINTNTNTNSSGNTNEMREDEIRKTEAGDNNDKIKLNSEKSFFGYSFPFDFGFFSNKEKKKKKKKKKKKNKKIPIRMRFMTGMPGCGKTIQFQLAYNKALEIINNNPDNDILSSIGMIYINFDNIQRNIHQQSMVTKTESESDKEKLKEKEKEKERKNGKMKKLLNFSHMINLGYDSWGKDCGEELELICTNLENDIIEMNDKLRGKY